MYYIQIPAMPKTLIPLSSSQCFNGSPLGWCKCGECLRITINCTKLLLLPLIWLCFLACYKRRKCIWQNMYVKYQIPLVRNSNRKVKISLSYFNSIMIRRILNCLDTNDENNRVLSRWFCFICFYETKILSIVYRELFQDDFYAWLCVWHHLFWQSIYIRNRPQHALDSQILNYALLIYPCKYWSISGKWVYFDI